MTKNKSNITDEPGWQSIREKWTVTLATGIVITAFCVVITILLYSIYQNNPTLIDKILMVFNAISMAVLGYLFGYVPTKASEENIRKDRETIEQEKSELKNAILDYRETIESKEKTIKDYEKIIALYETK